MRTYYTDYVNHALLAYYAGDPPQGEAQKNDFSAVDKTMRSMNRRDRDICRMLYNGEMRTVTYNGIKPMTMVEAVGKICKEFKIAAKDVWNIINQVETSVARNRGLIE